MNVAAEDILSSVQELCAETFRVPVDRAVPEARFVEDLEGDSLFIVQLTIAVEERFLISISEEETRELQTVQDMTSLVSKRVGAPEARSSSAGTYYNSRPTMSQRGG